LKSRPTLPYDEGYDKSTEPADARFCSYYHATKHRQHRDSIRDQTPNAEPGPNQQTPRTAPTPIFLTDTCPARQNRTDDHEIKKLGRTRTAVPALALDEDQVEFSAVRVQGPGGQKERKWVWVSSCSE